MTKKRKESPDKDTKPPLATQQQGEAAAQAPQPITPKNARPRLSGEGADAALLHLIEREKIRAAKSKLH